MVPETGEAASPEGVKPGKLHMPGTDVRRGIVQALESVIEHAVRAVEAVQSDRVTAVHEFRKSVRRARAVLALCRDEIPQEEFRALWRDLRDAARPTSHLRDADVFAAVLADVQLPPNLSAAADRVRTALATSPASADGVEAVLLTGVARVQDVPGRFAHTLAGDLDWRAVEQGLRRSYRAARRRLQRTLDSRDIDDYHDWRKRTKELNYQLELLTQGLDGEVAALRKDFSDFATELGTVTDRVNLAHRLGDEVSRLEDELDRASRAEKRARKKQKKSRKKRGKKSDAFVAKRAARKQATAERKRIESEKGEARRLARAVRREAEGMLSDAVTIGQAMFRAKPRRFARATIEGVLAARAEAGRAPETPPAGDPGDHDGSGSRGGDDGEAQGRADTGHGSAHSAASPS